MSARMQNRISDGCPRRSSEARKPGREAGAAVRHSRGDLARRGAVMAERWSRLLVEAIDPVLADSPFQAGQTGEPPADATPDWWTPRPGASVIWCGGYDEVVRAYPHLDDPQVDAEEYWCFDVTVEIDGDGRLAEVRLENGELPEAFAAMGRTQEASAAAALIGRPAEDAVPRLAALLGRLFAAPAGD
jgi:hypothetical protein